MTEKYTLEFTKKELPILKEIMMLGQFSLFHSNGVPKKHNDVFVKICKKINKYLGKKYPDKKHLADETEVAPLYQRYFNKAIEMLIKQNVCISFDANIMHPNKFIVTNETKEGK